MSNPIQPTTKRDRGSSANNDKQNFGYSQLALYIDVVYKLTIHFHLIFILMKMLLLNGINNKNWVDSVKSLLNVHSQQEILQSNRSFRKKFHLKIYT